MQNRTRKVLIVDDDSDNLLIISKILESEGYEVNTASTGEASMGFLKKKQVDLVILDVMLPDVLGTDLCVKLRNELNYKNVVIILVSGIKITSDDIAFGLEIGADDYISKPLKKKEFIARIKAIFRLKESMAQHRESKAELFEKSKTSQTAATFNQQDIKDIYPNEFEKLVIRYVNIIEAAIEKRFYKTIDNVVDDVKKLAKELEFMKAGARDVIDIHKEALEKTLYPDSAKKTFYIKEESRIALIELMGYLLNLYRSKF